MRGIFVALAIAPALGGCGTTWWELDSVGAASLDTGADRAVDSAAIGQTPGSCASDLDCAEQAFKYCDTTLSRCVECLVDSQCTQPYARRCGPLRRCVECLGSPQDTCGPGQVCHVTQQSYCVFACLDGGGCPSSAPLCNTTQSRFVCAECLTCADCVGVAAGPQCNTDTGRCGEATGSGPGCRLGVDEAGAPDAGDASSEASLDVNARDAQDGGTE